MSKVLGWQLKSAPSWGWPMEKAHRGRENRVRHRDHIYPKRFEVTWAREDGLEVTIDIQVDAVEGPMAMSVTISSPNGIHGDYRQPIPAMTRQAAAQVALLVTPDGNAAPVPAGRTVAMGRRPGRPTAADKTARLRKVAKAYRAADKAGEPVTAAVMRVEPHVTQSTAEGLIYKARKAGLLPETTSGRKSS